jgi:hypothetical protein
LTAQPLRLIDLAQLRDFAAQRLNPVVEFFPIPAYGLPFPWPNITSWAKVSERRKRVGMQFEVHRASQGVRPVGTIGMPKKEEHSQTHQNREAQKLVDRIEKKASTAQRLTTPKHDLRVVKWIGTVPAIGVCT